MIARDCIIRISRESQVILLLVQAHKMRQSHAAALRILLQGVADESASRKAPLTLADIQKELPKIQAQTDLLVDDEARQVEAALNGEGDFLETVRAYASRQFWNARPEGSLL
jgi:hypothetical protein